MDHFRDKKNGNLTYDGVYRYYYDGENRLTDVNNAAGTDGFLSKLEKLLGRRVRPLQVGRPRMKKRTKLRWRTIIGDCPWFVLGRTVQDPWP
jgi:hypothetical protein